MARLRFCKCGAVLASGERCDACKPVQKVQSRNMTELGYGADWQKLSRRYRDQHPLCEMCESDGKITPADHVHHVVKIKDDRTMRMRVDNLMSVCAQCHSVIHKEERQHVWG